MERVLVTRNMFFNHFPGKVERELKKLAAEVERDWEPGGVGPVRRSADGGQIEDAAASAGSAAAMPLDGCCGGGDAAAKVIPPGTVGDMAY